MFNHITSKSGLLAFVVSSGALRVTDPCYTVDTWCSGELPNVLNGKWNAQVGYFKDPSDAEGTQRYRQHLIDEENKLASLMIQAASERGEVADNLKQRFEENANRRIEQMRANWAEKDKNYFGRPAYLRIIHESQGDLTEEIDLTSFSKSDIDVGVDSGQAGFFDLSLYPKDPRDATHEQAFYSPVCDLSLSDASWGTLAFGAVSSSGYGDGSYDCYFRNNDAGQVVEAIIVFIGDGEDE